MKIDGNSPWGVKGTVLNALIGAYKTNSLPLTDSVEGQKVLIDIIERSTIIHTIENPLIRDEIKTVLRKEKEIKMINIAPYLGKGIPYLKNATPKDILKLEREYSDFRAELRSLVLEVLNASTLQDIKEISEQVKEKIEKEIEKINKIKKKMMLEAIGLVKGSITAVYGLSTGQILAAIGGAYEVITSLYYILESRREYKNKYNNSIYMFLESYNNKHPCFYAT